MSFISKRFDNHFHEGFKIKEIGMRLPKQQLNRLRLRLLDLIPKTPSSSFTTLTLKKNGPELSGFLNVSAGCQQFNSSTQGESLEKVFDVLERDMNEQLLRWKKSRFLTKFHHQDFLKQEEVVA